MPDRLPESQGGIENSEGNLLPLAEIGSERFLSRFAHGVKDFSISLTGQLIGVGVVTLPLIALNPYVDFLNPPANFTEVLKGVSLLTYVSFGTLGGMIAGQEIAHKLLDPKQNSTRS